MPDINTFDVHGGRIVKDDNSEINIANAVQNIGNGNVATVTMNPPFAAINSGNAYGVEFFDPTGITGLTTYWFYLKNTGTGTVHVATTAFNEGYFELYYVRGGTYHYNTSAFTPSLAIEMPSHNLNGNFLANTSKMKIYYQGAGSNPSTVAGATTGITWDFTTVSSAVVYSGSIISSEYAKPLSPSELNFPIAPGDAIMSSFSNLGIMKVPYQIKSAWWEE